jgi:hypothetical protein
VNGVRNFGITGLGGYTGGAGPAASTLLIANSYGYAASSFTGKCHFFTSGSYIYPCYGNDLTNNSFEANNPAFAQVRFNSNRADLRLQAARGLGAVPAVQVSVKTNAWGNGPAWAAVWNNMNVTSTSSNTVEITGNPAASVNAYAQLGISTLAVNQMPCSGGGAFVFQSMYNTSSLYWGERWECAAPAACSISATAPAADRPRPRWQAVQAAVPGGRLAVVVRHPED